MPTLGSGKGSTVGPGPSYFTSRYQIDLSSSGLILTRWLNCPSGSGWNGTHISTDWTSGESTLNGAGDYCIVETKLASNPSNISFGKTITMGSASSSTYGCTVKNRTGKYVSTATGTFTPYKVTFDVNGGTLPSGGKLNNASHTGSNFIVTVLNHNYYRDMSLDIPTRKGYTFKGWFTAKNGGTQVYGTDGWAVANTSYWDSNQCWIYKGNVTLYAQWKANTFTLTLNANGGTVSPTTKTIEYDQVIYEDEFLPIPTRDGYFFDGWFTSANGGITVDDLFINGSVTTFYAHWTKGYYLDLDVYVDGKKITGNSHSNISCNIYVNGAKVTSGGCIEYYGLHKSSHSYGIEYYCNSDYGKVYKTENLEGTISNSVTAKIYIGTKHTITYNSNDELNTSKIQEVYYSESWTTQDKIFTRSGYELVRWNTKADGSGDNYSLNTTQTDKQLSDVTLYAIWQKTSIQLPILMEDGTIIIGDVCPYVDGVWYEAISVAIYDEPTDTWREAVIPSINPSNLIDEATIDKSQAG